MDSASRKIRSISDGTFRGCYASNKAEKFKFNRLSLSLESCAHAQALKSRKEEKQVQKLLENLERDKRKYVKLRKKDSSVYVLPRIRPYTSMSRPSTRQRTLINSRLTSKDVIASELDASVTQLGSTTSRNTHGRRYYDENNWMSNAKSGTENAERRIRPNSRCYHEVTPFYLEHGYTQYHRNSSYYDNLLKDTDKLKQSDCHQDSDAPCWKKISNLCRLKSRRVAISADDPLLSNFIASLSKDKDGKHLVPKASTTNTVKSDVTASDRTTLNDFNSSTMVNCSDSYQNLASMDENSKQENNEETPQCSVLTEEERRELAKHNRRRAASLSAIISSPSCIINKLQKEKSRRNTVYAPGKNLLLRAMIQNRLKQGTTLEELLSDNTLDEILDVCDEHRIHPSYDPEVKLTFEDFRALRNCKYLRITDLNLKSLKEATILEIQRTGE